MIEPFLMRAGLAAIGLAIVAAPLGCFVVWNRMSYFGEAIAQASLLGVALGLLLHFDVTLSVFVVTLFAALGVVALTRQRMVPVDSVLGLLHHGALALGVIALASIKGQSVDLMGYLFGDIFAISTADLWWVLAVAGVVGAAMVWLWQPLLRVAVHDDLARAEGIAGFQVQCVFTLLLALVIAVAIKIVGILLAIAFLIIPAVAARPFVAAPEHMAIVSGGIGIVSSIVGIWISTQADVPGGPAIVVVMTAIALISLVMSGRRARQ